MQDDMTVFEAMLTQRQHIRFKTDPVPPEAIDRILEAATKAPNGANTQPWEFIVCTGEVKRRIGQLYKEAHLSTPPGPRPNVTPEGQAAFAAARTLAEQMPDVPVIILICVDHARGYAPYSPGEPLKKKFYESSILLACQNLFLAARALGLGTRLTSGTFQQNEQKFRDILGIPDHVELAWLTPLGYPVAKFSPPPRRPWQKVTSFNKFNNRAATAVGIA